MKLSSVKFFIVTLGFIASMAMTTGCNKGYGCPSDFSVEARTDAPAEIPSC